MAETEASLYWRRRSCQNWEMWEDLSKARAQGRGFNMAGRKAPCTPTEQKVNRDIVSNVRKDQGILTASFHLRKWRWSKECLVERGAPELAGAMERGLEGQGPKLCEAHKNLSWVGSLGSKGANFSPASLYHLKTESRHQELYPKVAMVEIKRFGQPDIRIQVR